ncbi:MAG: peptidyl-prolyl cis-trans isomerase [Candidatus Latescibacterota bacterium]|nr:MAG: peptidyl-prolyl cis-trans isomerase [Candidatus Latescibacterota bacterium]
MKAKLVFACTIGLIGAMLFVIGCSKDGDVSGDASDELAAEVEDWTLTRAELDEIVESLSDQQKAKFKTPEGKAELADLLIEEEIYHQEAIKEGFDKDKDVLEMLDKYKRSLLVNQYFDRVVKAKAAPTEQEIHDYYEANQDRYTKQPIVRAQHVFSTDREKLVKLKKEIDDGEPMTTIAHLHSEDEATRADGGNLGYFNPGGYIRGIGYSKELSDAAFSMQKGIVSDPIKWEKGYSLLRVNEIRPAELRPYDDVHDEIEALLTQQNLKDVKESVYAEVKKNYRATNHIAEEMMLTQRTPEELWNLAQTSTDSYQRIRHYEQIVEKYPDSNYAAEALFMIGFVYAEELKIIPDADRALNRVINEYPNSEIAATAEWMLQNLDKPLPEFEDLDDLSDKIKEQSE